MSLKLLKYTSSFLPQFLSLLIMVFFYLLSNIALPWARVNPDPHRCQGPHSATGCVHATIDLCSHTGPHAWKGPSLSSMLCYQHFEYIIFEQRAPHFHFAIDCKLHGRFWNSVIIEVLPFESMYFLRYVFSYNNH